VGEARLMERMDECFADYDALASGDRALIHEVLREIVRGQSLDLVRFGAASAAAPVALRNADELHDYTYAVAGCVGEFWTRLCSAHMPRYSDLALEELCALGRRYGMGLQLVNILRDAPADYRTGRCYLPADELPATLLHDAKAARATFDRWARVAREHLEQGRQYTSALRSARVRFACFVPWKLAHATLALLEKEPPLESETRVRVPRSAVHAAVVSGIFAAFSDLPLNRTCRLTK
jgi:farnesyl-diphosphate farnesyltransferase